ncbi:MAG: metallophosphoesterase [Anaerolineae bacterium]|nr:metallophosphoesterase [Anaerolineae bacterium]
MIKFENMAHRSIYQSMRLAVFADIHGNLPALNAVLADMEAAGDFDLIWCLGDLAALGGQPHECLAALLQLREAQGDDKFKIIGGNTDRYLVTGERMPAKAAENANDFAAYRDGSRRMNAVFAWNLSQLDWADYDLLRQIVGRELRREVPGYGRVIGIHAIPGDDEALALRPDSADEEAADALLDPLRAHAPGAGPSSRQLARDQSRQRRAVLRQSGSGGMGAAGVAGRRVDGRLAACAL